MNRKTIIAALALLISLPICLPLLAHDTAQLTQETAQESQETQDLSVNHPLKNDPTGINWVFSLEDAIQKARETNRIVILKPVSFRSSNDSDALSPSSEAQRAISFVDSRVVGLLNRRFVPYYFDMDEFGDRYDKTASDLTKVLYPEMKYLASIPTPPLLFMTPERKMLGHASNFLKSQELLDKLVEILEENPSYKNLTTAEKVITHPIEQAWLHYDLRDLDKATELLVEQPASEAYYLKVLIANELQDWPAMKFASQMVTDTHRRADCDVENVIRYWKLNNFEGIKAKGQRVNPENGRYQEAMYYLGLAHYHTKDKESAIATWKTAIEHNRESAWALRIDLALGLLKLNPGSYLSAQDTIPSELGRTYMCPNGIEDLTVRK